MALLFRLIGQKTSFLILFERNGPVYPVWFDRVVNVRRFILSLSSLWFFRHLFAVGVSYMGDFSW